MQDSQLRWMIGLSLLVLVLVAALSMGEGDGPRDGAAPALGGALRSHECGSA